jgi:hypothetical protein
MNISQEKNASLEDLIAIEEFKYWDAERNGCSDATLQTIQIKIMQLRGQAVLVKSTDLKKMMAPQYP